MLAHAAYVILAVARASRSVPPNETPFELRLVRPLD
jgi:hypothetical protein